MKRLQMDGPGDLSVLTYVDAEVPTIGPRQLLVQVDYAGLNFADSLARRGVAGYARRWPYVPGLEISGRVAAMGREVSSFTVGDAVTALLPDGGGLAEFAVSEATLTHLLPPGVDRAHAAAAPLAWATAVGVAQYGGVRASDHVFVTSAAGGVGAALAEVLAHLGATVLFGGVGSADKKRALHPHYQPIDRSRGLSSAIREAASGVGMTATGDAVLDVVLDSVGGSTLGEAIELLGAGGRVVSYGAAGGAVTSHVPNWDRLRAANLTVSGFSMLGLARATPHAAGTLALAVLHDHGAAVSAAPLSVVEWSNAVDAHGEQSKGRSRGKSVVKVSTGRLRS